MAFTGCILITLCQLVLVHSFLLNSSTSTSITSYEFQLLSKLILDEQMRTSHLEEDLRTLVKDQDVLKNGKATLETQLNNTKSELIATKQELNATNHALNDAKKELAKQIFILNATNSKLASIQRELNTINYVLNNTNIGLDGQIRNLDNVNATLTKETGSMRLLQTEYAALTTKYNSLSAVVNSTAIEMRKADVFSAFTVTGFQGRIDSITSGTLVFPNAQSNLGGHYNFTSGKFTCVYNGVYLFLLNLYYIPEGGWQLCWIRKNGSRIVEAFTYPIPAQSGKYAESTASVILRLTKAGMRLWRGN